jgi:hypothetical protein
MFSVSYIIPNTTIIEKVLVTTLYPYNAVENATIGSNQFEAIKVFPAVKSKDAHTSQQASLESITIQSIKIKNSANAETSSTVSLEEILITSVLIRSSGNKESITNQISLLEISVDEVRILNKLEEHPISGSVSLVEITIVGS